MFSCANHSSYDLLRKQVIIFVALRWTASGLNDEATKTARQIPDETWQIISLFLKKKFLFIKLGILLALPAASLHCRDNLRLDAIVTPRFLTHCTLSSLTPFILCSYFWFLVPVCIMWHLLTLKGISHFSDHFDIFSCLLGGSSCRGRWLSSSRFSYYQQTLKQSYLVRRRCHLCI